MTNNLRFPPDYQRNSTDTLETALSQLGAYKAWRAYDPGSTCDIDKRYMALPALTKRDIREHYPQGFIPPGKDFHKGIASGEIQEVKTSGTSDAVKVTNIWNQAWWDDSERASWKLNSHTERLATGNHPEAILVNARNVGIPSDEVDLPFEKRRLARYLYLNEKTNPASWPPYLMDRMIEELAKFQPVILESTPTLLAKFCRYVTAHRKKVFQPGLIVFTYEFPSALHQKQIRRVFSSPMVSSYGSTETGYVFMQCEEGKFHQNSAFCRVDIQPFKREHGGPATGRILVTTFNNPWYYVLRFDVGDLGRIDEKQTCPCGRNSGLILSSIEGRFINATLDCDGRLVTLRRLDEAISELDGLDEYRVEQPAPRTYVLHVASQRQDFDALDDDASHILRKIYGKPADISIVHEDFLVPEDSGKYSLAKTLFPLDINDYLDTKPVSR
jgi:phenylacetate-coenzyme A ligase PaaK-like adenylate-forming protein